MSHTYTPEQIRAQFDSLPTDIQQLISGPETAATLQEIGRQHSLRIDAIGTLIEYSGLVMLGLVKSNAFVDQLTRNLAISHEQAESIAVAVDTQVFSRIRNSLREVQYRSTTEQRFSELETPIGAVAQPTAVSTEPVEEPIPQELDPAMSSMDYNPQDFGSGSQTVNTATEPTAPEPVLPVSEDSQPSSELTNHSVTVPINTAPAPTSQPSYQSTEAQAYNKAAEQVIGKMPGAVKDAYKNRQVAAPQPATANPDVIKDFKTRLEEKMAVHNNSAVNTDPYKESI